MRLLEDNTIDRVAKTTEYLKEVATDENPSMALRHVVEHALDHLSNLRTETALEDAKRITNLALIVERELSSNVTGEPLKTKE